MAEIERPPRKSRRATAAFVFGPLAAAGATALLLGVLGALDANTSRFVAKVAGGTFAFALMFGYLAAAVLGVPGYWLFRRMGWSQRRHWLLLGGVVGGASRAFLSVAALLFAAKTASAFTGLVILGLVVTPMAALCMGLMFRWLLPSGMRDIEEVASRFD
jgi:energy-converting hydrogenase Eha subunit A